MLLCSNLLMLITCNHPIVAQSIYNVHTWDYFMNHLTNGRQGCTCCSRVMRCHASSNEDRRKATALRRFLNGTPSINRSRNADRNSNGGECSEWRMRSAVHDGVTSVKLVLTEMLGLVAALSDRTISSNTTPFTTTAIPIPQRMVKVHWVDWRSLGCGIILDKSRISLVASVGARCSKCLKLSVSSTIEVDMLMNFVYSCASEVVCNRVELQYFAKWIRNIWNGRLRNLIAEIVICVIR